MIPPNLRFEVDDFTEPWLFRKESFDLIHARSLFGCVADWPTFYREALEYVRTRKVHQAASLPLVLTLTPAIFSPADGSNSSKCLLFPNPTTAL